MVRKGLDCLPSSESTAASTTTPSSFNNQQFFLLVPPGSTKVQLRATSINKTSNRNEGLLQFMYDVVTVKRYILRPTSLMKLSLMVGVSLTSVPTA